MDSALLQPLALTLVLVRRSRLRVCDAYSICTTTTTTVSITNRAPTATFTAPTAVAAGSPIPLALTGVADPSSADQAAGFTYAFDCGGGTGYGSFTPASTASCPTTTAGSRTVQGRVRDKDGGASEYSTSVTVTAAGATTWYFAEGYTGEGFDEYLTIQNPNAQAGTATLTYLLEGASPVVRSVPLPPPAAPPSPLRQRPQRQVHLRRRVMWQPTERDLPRRGAGQIA